MTIEHIDPLVPPEDQHTTKSPGGVLIHWGQRTPWEHQRKCAEWLADKGSGYIAFEMGGGKSYVAIATIRAWGAKRTLILCPKSVMGVWRREYTKHTSHPVAVCVLDQTSAKAKANALRTAAAQAAGKPLVVVVNYETAWRPTIATELRLLGFDCVCLDESHRIKSPTGRASKFASLIGRSAKHRLCLSGTPMPHSPLDVWAQFRFLDPKLFGTSYTRFRARYAITDPNYPSTVRQWINQAELRRRLAPWMQRVRTADVVDMPEVQHERITVQLSPQSRRAYRELETYLETIIEGEPVEVTNKLTQLLRYQQITSGSITIDGRELVFGDEKRDALLDRLSDIHPTTPVVVFYRFASDLLAIRHCANQLKRRFGEISGRRKDLTPHSTMPEEVQIMAVQESAGGVGIDLTRAHHGFWFSLSYSLGDYEQANARLHRPGQRNNVTLYHLVAENTVDEAIYRALDQRRDIVSAVIEQLQHHHPQESANRRTR